MFSSRFVVSGFLVAAVAAVTGCSTQTESGKGQEDVASTESELRLSGTR